MHLWVNNNETSNSPSDITSLKNILTRQLISKKCNEFLEKRVKIMLGM